MQKRKHWFWPLPPANLLDMEPASLYVQYLDKKIRVKLTASPFTIGRLKENDLCIPIGSLSRRHAIIEYYDKRWIIKDLGSSNGLLFEGKRVDTLVLGHACNFRLGGAVFTATLDANEVLPNTLDQAVTRVKTTDETSFSTAYTSSAYTSSAFEQATTHESSLDELQPGISAQHDFSVGSEILGYQIQERIGGDHLQSTYKAHQISMDRTVTLKVLNKSHTSDQPFIDRFSRQAKISGSYNHPNIIHTLDCNQIDETFFYTVEWIEGETITALLKKETRLSVNQSLSIISDIARALSYIHKKGATHQNIKPESILVKATGEAKLADVGLFALFDSDKTTDTKKLVGSPHYMSPEQACGKELTDRSDVYSLGATLYHMITNRPPFDGDSPVVIIAKQIANLPDPPQNYDITIDDDLNNLVMEMLQKDPAMRPPIEKVLDILPNIATEITSVRVQSNVRKRRAVPKRRPSYLTILPLISLVILICVSLNMLTTSQRFFALEKAPWLEDVFKIIDSINPTKKIAASSTFITNELFIGVSLDPPKQTSRIALNNWQQPLGNWKAHKKQLVQENIDGGSLRYKTEIALAPWHCILQVSSILYPISLQMGTELKLSFSSSKAVFTFTNDTFNESRTVAIKLDTTKPVKITAIIENDLLEVGINGVRIYQATIQGIGNIKGNLELTANGPLTIERFEF